MQLRKSHFVEKHRGGAAAIRDGRRPVPSARDVQRENRQWLRTVPATREPQVTTRSLVRVSSTRHYPVRGQTQNIIIFGEIRPAFPNDTAATVFLYSR